LKGGGGVEGPPGQGTLPAFPSPAPRPDPKEKAGEAEGAEDEEGEFAAEDEKDLLGDEAERQLLGTCPQVSLSPQGPAGEEDGGEEEKVPGG
jgi:hypothetical protein